MDQLLSNLSASDGSSENKEALKRHLAANHDLLFADKQNNCLSTACLKGHVAVVQCILEYFREQRTDLQKYIDQLDLAGSTPLLNASYSGNGEICELLIKGKANTTIRAPHKRNIAHIACSRPRNGTSALEVFNKHKLMPSLLMQQDVWHLTPIDVAKKKGTREMLKIEKHFNIKRFLDSCLIQFTPGELEKALENIQEEDFTLADVRQLQVPSSRAGFVLPNVHNHVDDHFPNMTSDIILDDQHARQQMFQHQQHMQQYAVERKQLHAARSRNRSAASSREPVRYEKIAASFETGKDMIGSNMNSPLDNLLQNDGTPLYPPPPMENQSFQDYYYANLQQLQQQQQQRPMSQGGYSTQSRGNTIAPQSLIRAGILKGKVKTTSLKEMTESGRITKHYHPHHQQRPQTSPAGGISRSESRSRRVLMQHEYQNTNHFKLNLQPTNNRGGSPKKNSSPPMRISSSSPKKSSSSNGSSQPGSPSKGLFQNSALSESVGAINRSFGPNSSGGKKSKDNNLMNSRQESISNSIMERLRMESSISEEKSKSISAGGENNNTGNKTGSSPDQHGNINKLSPSTNRKDGFEEESVIFLPKDDPNFMTNGSPDTTTNAKKPVLHLSTVCGPPPMTAPNNKNRAASPGSHLSLKKANEMKATQFINHLNSLDECLGAEDMVTGQKVLVVGSPGDSPLIVSSSSTSRPVSRSGNQLQTVKLVHNTKGQQEFNPVGSEINNNIGSGDCVVGVAVSSPDPKSKRSPQKNKSETNDNVGQDSLNISDNNSNNKGQEQNSNGGVDHTAASAPSNIEVRKKKSEEPNDIKQYNEVQHCVVTANQSSSSSSRNQNNHHALFNGRPSSKTNNVPPIMRRSHSHTEGAIRPGTYNSSTNRRSTSKGSDTTNKRNVNVSYAPNFHLNINSSMDNEEMMRTTSKMNIIGFGGSVVSSRQRPISGGGFKSTKASSYLMRQNQSGPNNFGGVTKSKRDMLLESAKMNNQQFRRS